MAQTKAQIKEIIESNVAVKKAILSNVELIETIEKVADKMATCFKNSGKVLFCGNGGSAADAQHLAAELSGRFYYDRPSLPAEAIHVNTSYLTAVANDYSFDEIYSRYVSGVGKPGDMLLGISTSGNSENILRAIIEAKKQGMITVALTGTSGGKMKEVADFLINIPSTDTPRIQESHILIGHIICELVEKEVFPK
jgi:D-sedoheptulose 7-phosphate isomerase